MIITQGKVWGIYVLEDTESDVAFYCIGVFNVEHDAYKVKKMILNDIDKHIDAIEENDEEYFTVDHCSDMNVKKYLINANLNEGIQVRNCKYKIFVSEEVLYK